MALIEKNISTGDLNRIVTKVSLAINEALLEREDKGKAYCEACRTQLAEKTALSICKTLGITVSDDQSHFHQIEALAAQRRSSDKISITSCLPMKAGYLAIALYSSGKEGTEHYWFLEEAVAIYREENGPKAGELRIGWTHILSES